MDSIFNVGIAVLHRSDAPSINPQYITRQEFKFDCKDIPFQKEVWDEFWSHHQAVYAENTKDARPVKEEWKRFLELWSSLTQDQNKPVILSDNPVFDIGVIDKQLTALGLGTGLSIRYSPSGKYIKVHDPSAATFLLSPKAKEDMMTIVNSIAPHTHRAIDDALHILHLHMQLESLKSTLVM